MTSPLAPVPGPQVSIKDMLTPVWRSWFNQLYQYLGVTQTQIASLTTSAAASAPLASPALTGTPTINGVAIRTGTGSPNGSVTGNPGDLYLNKSGGASTTLYVKESGTATNTGWVGK